MSRARVLADRANQNTLAVDTTNSEVGIASTVPNATLDVRGEVKVGTAVQLGVAGVVTATSFSGSGSNLTGLATTETVRADTLTVAGVSTLTGAVNVDATTDSTSTSTGALIVDGGAAIAKNVYIGAGLSVAGTLTYEDVTNVDSVGLITAKSGVNVSGGQLQVGVAYSVGAAGVATAAGFVGPLTGAVTGNVTGNADTATTAQNLVVVDESSSTNCFPLFAAASATGNKAAFTGTNLTFNSSSGALTATSFVGALTGNVTGTASNASGATGDFSIADKIVHTGDTNTAIRFPANDTFTVETAAVEQFRVTSGGMIGVNTTTPNLQYYNNLVVGNNTSGDKGITIRSKSDAQGVLAFSDTDASTSARYAGKIAYSHDDNSMRFYTLAGDERVRINSAGLVGINTTTLTEQLEVDGDIRVRNQVKFRDPNGDETGAIGMGDDDNFTIQSFGTSGHITFDTGSSADERARIDSSGRLLVGQTAGLSLYANGLFQVSATDGTAALSVTRFSANGSSPYINLGKSRSGTVGTYTIVQDGDRLGQINFTGADGTDLASPAAGIAGFVDGTPGSNDMPGRLVFTTASDGGVTETERLRITSTGSFQFSNGALTEKVNITAGKLSDNTNIDLADGMVHYFTTQESTTCTPNIRVSSAVELNDIMTAGDVITVTLVTTAAAGGYSANILIDSQTITEEWVGGEAPSAGGDDGLDIYIYTIICIHASNTGDSGFKVIANKVNATN